MKISARGASLAIVLALAGTAWCQDTRPSLLPLPPMPPVGSYTVSPAAATDALWGAPEQSPVQTGPVQAPQQILSTDYASAMKGGYESCSTIAGPCGGTNCCSNHYIYANALVMTHVKGGGFVTSVDEVDGSARVFFCDQEFGNLWHGGFEVGAGWCFGGGCGSCGGGCGTCCNTNAIELVYWGIFPGIGPARDIDDMNSTIDFSALTYRGANAQDSFDSAPFHQVDWDFSFNSLEANLVGNCLGGGPFGCGMCGCGYGGSRWGFGYTAGFRWMQLSDRFLFSSDPVGNSIDHSPEEINYAVASTNSMFGFQIGSGLSYRITDRLYAYTIGKMGVYNNHITSLQKVYGPSETAVITATLQDFDLRSSDDGLAVSGQLDIGGRWNVTDLAQRGNFGYRVLGLAGVAIAETQVRHDQFHNVDGIQDIQSQGTFLLHGAYTGVTYCW